jgi:4-hydroxybenzoate polyprenyltransferase
VSAARQTPSQVTVWLDATALPIAVIGAAVSASAFILIGGRPDAPTVLMAAAGAFLVYLIDRAWVFSPEDVTNRPERIQWHARHPRYRWGAGALGLAVAGSACWNSPTAVQWTAIVLGLASLIHVTSIGGRRGKTRPVLKLVLIAVAWGLGSAVLPMMLRLSPESAELLLAHERMSLLAVAAARAMVVGANVLVSDIHDIDGDARIGIRSVSATLGAVRARWAAVGLLLGAVVVAGVMVVSTGNYLWAVEALGMVVFAMLVHPGRKTLPGPLALDLLVGWPLITLLAWAIL